LVAEPQRRRTHRGPRPRRTGSPVLGQLGSEDVSVGRRLRQIRAVRGLSMRALADLSGLNVNTLSLIENGHSSPSVSTLQQLAQSLQIPIGYFFERPAGDLKLVHQHGSERSRVAFEHGSLEDLAAGMPHVGAEPLILTLKPAADSGLSPIVHTGREFVYCLDGSVSYTVKDRDYALAPGDSLVFEAYLPHRWKNPSARASRILLVLCPTDVHDSPRERHFST
jgi:transcriptional regulator with XRE-family HTH domain